MRSRSCWSSSRGISARRRSTRRRATRDPARGSGARRRCPSSSTSSRSRRSRCRASRATALRAELNLTMHANANFLPVRVRRALHELARGAARAARAGGGGHAAALYEAGFTELGAFTMGRSARRCGVAVRARAHGADGARRRGRR